jgi:lysophospholipase L1-like esterase
MKVLFLGDSITDMGRNRERDNVWKGNGYVFFAAGDIKREDPSVEVINRGISGNRIVDLYARIKMDVWNLQPDVLSILIGINDIWHEIISQNGVELDRFIKVYDMLISDTLKVLPKVKIILCEPFVLKGTATEENYERFLQVKEYAKAIKGLAEKYSLEFLPLQDAFDKAAEKTQASDYLYDGVHPDIAGARLIADEWMNLYNEKIKK